MDAGDYLKHQKALEDSNDESNGGFGAGEWNAGDSEIGLDIIF
jgi:hypothetical protein